MSENDLDCLDLTCEAMLTMVEDIELSASEGGYSPQAEHLVQCINVSVCDEAGVSVPAIVAPRSLSDQIEGEPGQSVDPFHFPGHLTSGPLP